MKTTTSWSHAASGSGMVLRRIAAPLLLTLIGALPAIAAPVLSAVADEARADVLEHHFGNHQALVNDTVPGMLQRWLPRMGEMGAGDQVAKNIRRLRVADWYVEDFKRVWGRSARSYRPRYRFPEQVKNADSEAIRDYAPRYMFANWENWGYFFYLGAFNSKKKYLKSIDTHFYHIVAPQKDRVYDIIVFRPSNPRLSLSRFMTRKGLDAVLWGAVNPADATVFDRGIFRDANYLEPEAAKRFDLGRYTVMEAYARRYFSRQILGGVPVGRWRGRDVFTLFLLSKKELIAIQTFPSGKVTRAVLQDDLNALLGAIEE